MQKVKQIFSSNDDADRSPSGSPTTNRTSVGSNLGSTTDNTSNLGTRNSAGLGNEGLNSSSAVQGNPSGLTSSNRTSDIGVGERGLGRDPVAGSTGQGTMSHGNNPLSHDSNRTSVAGAGATTGTTAGSGLTDASRGTTGTTGTTGSTAQNLKEKLTGGHSFGHDNRTDNKFDPTGENTQHDHKHLQAVTHATHRHQEVEEVQREREHHRHVHHLQHHVQPVLDTQAKDEVHHHNKVPVTHIHEKHANTEEDTKLFHSLGEKHRNEEKHLPKERTVVDLGENVNEVTHHHVHHVTQPVVEQEIHNKHRIHTTIPLTHTVHEAPIIHKSSHHEPVHMTDFLKGGGKLDSGISHHNAGILSDGECERSVDGVGERLSQELNLKPSSFGHHGTTGTGADLTSGTGATTGATTGRTGL